MGIIDNYFYTKNKNLKKSYLKVLTKAVFGIDNIFRAVEINNISNYKYKTSQKEHNTYPIREDISCAELLKEIRTEQILEIKWFDNSIEYPLDLEGPCLIVFRDRQVKQCFIPINDLRTWFALESHNVKAGSIQVIWEKSTETPFKITPNIAMQINTYAPIMAIGLIFAIIQWFHGQKDDKSDREKIRQHKVQERILKEKKIRNASIMESAFAMAEKGKSLDFIENMLKRYDLDMLKHEIAQIVLKNKNLKKYNRSSYK